MKVNIGKYNDDLSPRDINVEIDDYDVWGLDHTLALIILPALKKLKEVQQGSPIVDNEDVPEELHVAEGVDDDPNFFKKWDYVLDEMIWAFTQILDDDSDNQFHTGTRDSLFQPLDKDHNPIGELFPFGEVEKEKSGAKFYSMVKGPNDTSRFDAEGYKKHHNRIQNGTTLFGKYYNGLWD